MNIITRNKRIRETTSESRQKGEEEEDDEKQNEREEQIENWNSNERQGNESQIECQRLAHCIPDRCLPMMLRQRSLVVTFL